MMKVPRWCLGEFVGTFLLVFFGCGSVCVAVLTGVEMGLFQVAMVWGMGVAVAIYLTASLSGAHLNPAVTVAMAVFGEFDRKLVPGYVIFQVLGAFVAAAVLHGIFGSVLVEFETAQNITRGEAGSEASAMIYGEYFPNPGGEALSDERKAMVTLPRAFFVECMATAVLLLVICVLTDREKTGRLNRFIPVLIGLTVALLIVIVAPLTQAAFNPARDFGPRLFSALAGWKGVPFTTNGQGWWLVYIIAPTTGGLLGAWLYRKLLAPAYSEEAISQGE